MCNILFSRANVFNWISVEVCFFPCKTHVYTHEVMIVNIQVFPHSFK